MLEQPDVGGIPDPGTADNEIGDGSETARAPGCAAQISVQECKDQIPCSRCGDLPAGGAEKVHVGLPALGQDRAQRPTERATNQAERSPEFAAAEASGSQLGPNQNEQSENSEEQSGFAAV